MHRRTFFKHTSLLGGAILLNWQPFYRRPSAEGKVRFAMVADAHQDIMHDAEERLSQFMEAALAEEMDFHIQLGDFCEPKQKNLSFLQLWKQYKGPKYHVLGNHDMDSATKAVTMEYWEMPDQYYSFDQAGFHFIVLDANFLNLEFFKKVIILELLKTKIEKK